MYHLQLTISITISLPQVMCPCVTWLHQIPRDLASRGMTGCDHLCWRMTWVWVFPLYYYCYAFPSHGSHGHLVTFLILHGTFPTCSDSCAYHVSVYKSYSLGTYFPSNLLNFHPTNPSLLSLHRFLLACLKIYLVAWIVWSNTKQLKSLVHST